MKSQLTKATDGTITLTIPLIKSDIAKVQEKVVEHALKEIELPGFRKGKAPRKLAMEKLDPMKVKENTLRELLPKAYSEAVLEHALKPVISPKIHVSKLEENNDWEFIATTCETPNVVLNDYKNAVRAVTAKSKIVLPDNKQQEASFDDILQAVLSKTQITIPSVLVESEVERLLSQLLDEIRSLGLTLDQYLGSTHKTIEQVKKEYTDRAQREIAIEFVLQKIADEEKVSVSPEEVTEAIAKAKSPEEKENLQKNTYLLAAILRQQKTFDFLKNL